MSVAIISTLIICFTYWVCKKTQTNAYERVHQLYVELEDEKLKMEKARRRALEPKPLRPDSPYKLKRVMHNDSGVWGYTISMKNTDEFYTHKGTYQVMNFDQAKRVLNETENAEGYTMTAWE